MKRKRKLTLCIILIIILTGALFIMTRFGLLSKRYTIGKDVSLKKIEHVYMYSSGMSSDDCWHYYLDKEEDGRYFVKTEKYVPGDEPGYTRQVSVSEEITSKQWNALMKCFEDHVYGKEAKPIGKSRVLDGTNVGVSMTWPGGPDGYALAIGISEMRYMRDLIEVFISHPGEKDLRLLIAVEYGCSGDSIGSSDWTRLYCKDGSWFIEKESSSGNGSPTVKNVKETGPSVIRDVRQIVSEYDWKAFPDLPQSEFFACDAATYSLSFTFVPFDSWRISDLQDLSDEAREMWKRIQTVISEAYEK